MTDEPEITGIEKKTLELIAKLAGVIPKDFFRDDNDAAAMKTSAPFTGKQARELEQLEIAGRWANRQEEPFFHTYHDSQISLAKAPEKSEQNNLDQRNLEILNRLKQVRNLMASRVKN